MQFVFLSTSACCAPFPTFSALSFPTNGWKMHAARVLRCHLLPPPAEGRAKTGPRHWALCSQLWALMQDRDVNSHPEENCSLVRSPSLKSGARPAGPVPAGSLPGLRAGPVALSAGASLQDRCHPKADPVGTASHLGP